MIIDSFLFVLSNVLRLLLFPLEGINIAIDFLSSIPFLGQFFSVIAYIIPWANFVPLFILVIVIINFKIAISFIKSIWELLPFV